MTQTLNFVPASITVRTTAGASLSFSVSARNSDGTPFDLSGYTIEAPLLPREEFVPPVAAFDVALTDVSTLTLSLADAQTLELGASFTPVVWPWCVWIANEGGRAQLVRGGLSIATP